MRYFQGHGGFVQAIAFSPDGTLLASGGTDGEVRLWELVRASARQTIALSPRHEWVGAITFSPDGQSVCIGHQNGTIHVWDLATQSAREPPLARDQGRVTAIRFTPRARSVLWVGDEGGTVVNLPRRAGATPLTFKDGTTVLTFALAVAPTGNTFATGGTAPAIYLRALPGGERTGRLAHGDRQGCWALAYAPNGGTLAAGLGSGLQLWDTTTLKLRAHLTDHQDLVSGVAFSPDGGRLLTCGWDGVARLYAFDPAAGQVIRELGRYDWKLGRLFDVAISPDGTLAAACGLESPYLVVWDVE